MAIPSDVGPHINDAALAQQGLLLENEKLRLEIEQMKQPKTFADRIEKFLPMLTVGVAVAGVLLSVIGLRGELARANETRELELRKPFWERQLQQYFDASDAAAKIATAKNPGDRRAAEAKFRALYWGPLAIVEDAGMDEPKDDVVELAMVHFGDCLDGTETCSDLELKQRSLSLAHQCRASVGMSWNVKFAELTPRQKP